jgi:hypothetical protein
LGRSLLGAVFGPADSDRDDRQVVYRNRSDVTGLVSVRLVGLGGLILGVVLVTDRCARGRRPS